MNIEWYKTVSEPINAMTGLHKFGNKLLTKLASSILHIKVHDSQCGIRAIRGDLVSSMHLRSEGMPFALEMLVEAKQLRARIVERPVRYHARIGETKVRSFTDGFHILATLIRLMRDYRPILFFSGLGSVFIAVGLFFGVELVREYIDTGTVSRIPTAILVAIMMSVGVQLFSFGLLADMLKSKFSRRFS